MEVAKLSGVLLDYWVAKAQGFKFEFIDKPGDPYSGPWVVTNVDDQTQNVTHYRPSKDWADAGPLIELTNISLLCLGEEIYAMKDAWQEPLGFAIHGFSKMSGPDVLTAAMRCFVSSRLGDRVPDEVERAPKVESVGHALPQVLDAPLSSETPTDIQVEQVEVLEAVSVKDRLIEIAEELWQICPDKLTDKERGKRDKRREELRDEYFRIHPNPNSVARNE